MPNCVKIKISLYYSFHSSYVDSVCYFHFDSVK